MELRQCDVYPWSVGSVAFASGDRLDAGLCRRKGAMTKANRTEFVGVKRARCRVLGARS